MFNWMNNKEWRKKVKHKKIYLMRNHYYAFSAWEIERLQSGIDSHNTLIHVDAHLDDVPDGLEIKGILEKIESSQQAINITKHPYMRIDNFIWPAIFRNTIGNVYYVSPNPQTEFSRESLKKQVFDKQSDYKRNDIRDDILAENLLNHLEKYDKHIYRFQSIEEFLEDKDTFLNQEDGKKLILDLDLDYFNDSNTYNSNPKLKNEQQIIKNLLDLRNLVDWTVITVALSPEHCGGEQACQYLYNLFLNCFEISEKDLIDW